MSEPFGSDDRRSHDPPLDQQPVDHQPVPPRVDGADGAAPMLPRLPGQSLDASQLDGPSIVQRPAGAPPIPPLETTTPMDFVDAGVHAGVDAAVVPTLGPAVHAQYVGAVVEKSDFEPLRADPPPSLASTWWLRTAILTTMMAAPIVTLWVEYRGAPDDVRSSVPVVAVHAAAAVLLLAWSFLAMYNAARLTPPSRYQRQPNGSVAVLLWLLAGVAPLGIAVGASRLGDRLDDADDLGAVFSMIAIVVLVFLLVWLPFRYLARQASKVGAPHRAMISWFFAPLVAGVGSVLIVSLGLGVMLAEDGLTASERVIQLGVAYGAPMLVFALSTWRAVKVFDEVLDLRWRRWRTDWEETLDRLAGEPLPGPEGSPSIDGLRRSN